MSRVWGLGSAAALCVPLLCWGCAESETLKYAAPVNGGASGSAGSAGASSGTGGLGGSAQGGSAQGGSTQGGSTQGGSNQGGSASGGSAGQAGSSQGGANQGGSAAGGSGNAGSGNAGSGNGGGAGQPTGTDPALGLPDGNGAPCPNVGGSCSAGGDPGICRIYSQTEGRCESCTSCSGLNQFCAQSSDCDILFQCYQGQCIELCDLTVGCSGVLDWCVDVGNDQYGVCVYPN